MSIFDVPQSEWAGFCERFTRENQGKPVTVELTADPDDPDAERELLAVSLPLQNIAITNLDYGHIAVLVGEPSGRLTRFSMLEPERLRMEQHGEDQGGLLRVDDGSQSMILRFAEPLIPGELDGMP